MEKTDILLREDVESLVHTFYSKVRTHDALGPIFNQAINDWDDHLKKLCDFWETNLFFCSKIQRQSTSCSS
jgi:hemoglobin